MHTLRLYSFLLWVIFGSHADASEPKAFTIGVESINYAPLWSIESNQYSGFARELLDLFAAKHNYRFSFRALPINRLWVEFASGKIDLKFPDNPNWGGARKSTVSVYYSKEAFSYVDGILVKKERLGMAITQVKRLGVIRGFTPSNDILYNDIEIFEATNMKQLFSLLMADRIDGIYSNILVAKHHLNENSYPADLLAYDSTLPHTDGHYVLSSVKHPALIAEFSIFLQAYKKDIDGLKRKYNISLE